MPKIFSFLKNVFLMSLEIEGLIKEFLKFSKISKLNENIFFILEQFSIFFWKTCICIEKYYGHSVHFIFKKKFLIFFLTKSFPHFYILKYSFKDLLTENSEFLTMSTRRTSYQNFWFIKNQLQIPSDWKLKKSDSWLFFEDLLPENREFFKNISRNFLSRILSEFFKNIFKDFLSKTLPRPSWSKVVKQVSQLCFLPKNFWNFGEFHSKIVLQKSRIF